MDQSVYDRMQKQDTSHWWFVARRRILSEEIARLCLPREARILEAGCGAGGNLSMLARFGETCAMELDPTMREVAAIRSGIEILPGCLPGEIPFPPASFDLVAAFDVIEHIDRDGEAVEALARLLRPGGAMAITVPAYRWMWSDHDREHHHKRRYVRREVGKLMENAGLEIRRLTYFNTLLLPLVAAARLAGRVASGNGRADDNMPAAPLNAALREIFALERHLLKFAALPAGVSILCIARKV